MAIKIRKRREDDGSAGGAQNDPIEMEPGVGVAPAGSDPILDATMQGMSWIERNRNLVFGGLIVVIVGALGAWIYSGISASQQVSASQALSPALWDYEVLVEGSETYQQIEESELIPLPSKTYPSEEARWEDIYKTAGEALSANPSGDIAQSARVVQAGAAMRLKKHDEAVKLYSAYLDGKTSPAILPLVYLGLASAHAATGEVDEAVKNFEELRKINDSYESMSAYEKARLLDSAGKTDEARELYHEILESDPETPYRDEIERRLALL